MRPNVLLTFTVISNAVWDVTQCNLLYACQCFTAAYESKLLLNVAIYVLSDMASISFSKESNIFKEYIRGVHLHNSNVSSRFSEPCVVIYVRNKNQQNKHIFINDLVQLCCFRHVSKNQLFILRKASTCSFMLIFHAPYKQTGRYHDPDITYVMSMLRWSLAG
jgi:hypothetical protein